MDVTRARTGPGRLLLVAFHYPPANASGTLRSLKFTRYLPQFGWDTSVLTVPASCHESLDPALLAQVPPAVRVHHAYCVDSRRAFSWRGHYPAFTAVPDRYISWLPFGVRDGLRAVRTDGVNAILSTSPVPTAHLLALVLKRLTGVPWVADFRDPWGSGQRRGSLRRRVEDALEARVLRSADRVVGTTPELVDELDRRAGGAAHGKAVAIYNGYDEPDFADLDAADDESGFTITHGGFLYSEFRNPAAFLRAVRLGMDRHDLPSTTRIRLLGSGPLAGDAAIQRVLVDLGLQSHVEVVERLPYADALRVMNRSSVLLVLQGGQETRTQIPNKAFEYLRLGRLVICLAPTESATSRVMRDFDGVYCAEPDDVEGIALALGALAGAWRQGQRRFDRAAAGVARYSRLEAARALAELLHGLQRP